jgi:hypothetical protein
MGKQYKLASSSKSPSAFVIVSVVPIGYLEQQEFWSPLSPHCLV